MILAKKAPLYLGTNIRDVDTITIEISKLVHGREISLQVAIDSLAASTIAVEALAMSK